MTVLMICFTVGVVILLFLIGPKTLIDERIRALELPEDLDEYLKTSESRFSDITPDTEKTIVWVDPEKKAKTSVSIVYIHGFSATRQEVAPLCDIFAQRSGANLFYTRLTGHGRGSLPMGAARVNDWLNDTVEALEIGRQIGEKVIVMSVSTGGTLATWLATREQTRDVLAYILISPNFMPYKSTARFLNLPWARVLLPRIFGDTYTWEPFNERHGQYWTTSHPIEAVFQMMALVQMVRDSNLGKIRTPTYFFFSTQDRVVNSKESEKIYARFGSPVKKNIYIENSQDPVNHVIAGDILSPNTTEPIAQAISDFVKPLLTRQ